MFKNKWRIAFEVSQKDKSELLDKYNRMVSFKNETIGGLERNLSVQWRVEKELREKIKELESNSEIFELNAKWIRCSNENSQLRQEKSELQKELDRKVAEVESLMRANSIDTKVNEQIIEHLYHKLALAKSKKLEKEYNDGEN